MAWLESIRCGGPGGLVSGWRGKFVAANIHCSRTAGDLRRIELFHSQCWSLARNWSVVVPPPLNVALAATLVQHAAESGSTINEVSGAHRVTRSMVSVPRVWQWSWRSVVNIGNHGCRHNARGRGLYGRL